MKNIHFIAIGGAIMHQLAIALKREGYQVTGSDDEINDPAKTNLLNEGLLPVANGWYPEKLGNNVDAVVLGMHARADNPELIAAQAKGIPIYSFPQYVYEVSKNKKRLVIAGSHGKTTITSMVMHILKENGLDFDYLVGAKVAGFEQSVKLTDAPIIVIEGDEYPASVIEKRPKILFYHPHISVLSGIAWDHINVFPTYDIYFEQFEQYLTGLEKGTTVFYNAEDEEVVRAVYPINTIHSIPYHTPKFHYEDGTPIIATENGPVSVSVFGRHNIQNIAAAVSVCTELGISIDKCYKAIATFTGAARRLEKVKEEGNLLVYRDFAHAPSKLKATLNAVREAYYNRTLIACFELHTFSSLNEKFMSEYAHSMDNADTSIVFFSHHALQLKGLPEINKENVKKYFEKTDLEVIDSKDVLWSTVEQLVKNSEKPVFLLLMSSGTFDGIDWNNVSSH